MLNPQIYRWEVRAFAEIIIGIIIIRRTIDPKRDLEFPLTSLGLSNGGKRDKGSQNKCKSIFGEIQGHMKLKVLICGILRKDNKCLARFLTKQNNYST